MADRTPERPGVAGPGSLAPAALVLTAFVALGVWFGLGALQHPHGPSILAGSSAVMESPASGGPSASSAVAPLDGFDVPNPRTPPMRTGDASAVLAAGTPVRSLNADAVDEAWASATASATGIPLRALRGYAGAEIAVAREAPGCGIRWNTLAALGSIESAHGTHAGSAIGDDGVTRPGIFGIDLTGEASAHIPDTDGGRWDGTRTVDRAVGPMQFIPATWDTWGADGDGDGVADPQQIDDAALAAARYLCHHGDLTDATRWRTAIFAYNHLDTYVDAIAHAANEYAARVAG